MAMLFLLSIITYLDRVCMNVAIPSMSDELGLSLSQRGWVLGIFALAYGVFEIPGGWLGDRFGPRKILTRIVAWWSAFTAATGAVGGYGSLLWVRGLFGAGEAGAYPNASCTISHWFPAHERARAHGIVWMASRLGGALTPFLVVPLQQQFGWRTTFYLLSIPGFIWAVAWYVWFRDSPREKEGVNEAELNIIGEAPGASGHSLSFRQVVGSSNLWFVMLMYHCFCYGSFWFLVWTFSYLQEAKGFDPAMAASFTALPFVLGAAANIAGGWTSDRLVKRVGLKWGRRIVGAGGVGTAGVLMLLSLAIGNPYAAAVVLALAFAASDFMLPNCWAVCLDIGKQRAGAITGAMNTAGQMGSFIVSTFYGRLVESYGWNLPLVGIAAMSLISAALWFKIDPTKQLSDEAA